MPDSVSVAGRRPFVSPKAAKALGVVGLLLGASAAVLPGMYATGAVLTGALLAFVAGLALPQLRFAAGRPLVPLALAGPLGMASAMLLDLSSGMPDTSTARAAMVLGGAVLAFLAGKALEAPALPAVLPLPETPAEALEVLPVGELPETVAGPLVAESLRAFPVGR